MICIDITKVASNYRKPTNRVKVEELKDVNVANEFVCELEEKFAQIGTNEANDIEFEWKKFTGCIT